MFRGTTILCVRKNKKVAIGGDGQVSFNDTVLKSNAKKIRTLYEQTVIAGFAGATADAFTLFEKFEGYLQKYEGNLTRSSVEMAKEWRTDKILRRLEAMLIVADKTNTFLLSGTGDVIEPEEHIIGIGSGGTYALAAAKALIKNTKLEAKDIVKKSLQIASEICVYTNDKIIVKTL